MPPDVDSKARSKPSLPKHLQTPLRPSPHRTTSQVSSISVEASLPDQESSSSRTLLSKDPKYHRQRPHSQSHTSARNRAITDSNASGKTSPMIQRTLSAPGTPGRATSTSAHQPSTASTRSPSAYSLSLQAVTGTSVSASATTTGSGSGSGTGTSTPSRKGKEKAVDEVEVEGEMVVHDGDATKGLRELVRRTTIGEASAGHHPSGTRPTDDPGGTYLETNHHLRDETNGQQTRTDSTQYNHLHVCIHVSTHSTEQQS